jgi:3-deoxy-D-manno-octulosonate 8-phosphate phosphatase (KDO 8-P phosphatase)
MKAFNIKDGYALHEMLPTNGITPVIITGRDSDIVTSRAKELGISQIYQGAGNKAETLRAIAEKAGCELREIAYAGDDVNDLEAMSLCGFKACPADAAAEIKNACDYVSEYNGGDGAVRDICEQIIRL